MYGGKFFIANAGQSKFFYQRSVLIISMLANHRADIIFNTGCIGIGTDPLLRRF